MSTLEYRPDIDGLRALAVLPVVLYHAGFGAFGGGYFGVDVFFVISGFLISGIILDEARDGQFSYLKFYERRARRLLPALFTMIIATFAAAYFILLPEDYGELSLSSLWAMLFGSNFYFHASVNYYAQAADLMPLLHTWSLAVEEQFYLVWPPVLIASVWLKKRFSGIVGLAPVLVLVVISLVASVARADAAPESVFYMTWFRLWELGSGALVAIALRRGLSVRRLVAVGLYVLGATLVVAAMFWDGTSTGTRSVILVLVCLGTSMMLFTGESNPAAKLFETRPVVLVGRMSYSLYLWHWPVFALFRVYQNDADIARGDALWLLPVVFVFAAASYFLIEKPLRTMPSLPRFALRGGALATLSFLVALSAMFSSGFQFRIGDQLDYVASRSVTSVYYCEKQRIRRLGKLCVLGEPLSHDVPVLLMWGDSHTDHLAPMIHRVARENNAAVVLYSSCTPSIDNIEVQFVQQGEAHSKKCGKWRNRGLKWLHWTDYDVRGLIIAGAWAGQVRDLRSIGPDANPELRGHELTELGLNSFFDSVGTGRPVLLLSDMPRPGKNLIECAYKDLTGIIRRQKDYCGPMPFDRVVANHGPTTKALYNVAEGRPHIQVADLVAKMCDERGCPLFLGDRILYRDHNHIRSNLNNEEIETLIDRLGLRSAFKVLLAQS